MNLLTPEQLADLQARAPADPLLATLLAEMELLRLSQSNGKPKRRGRPQKDIPQELLTRYLDGELSIRDLAVQSGLCLHTAYGRLRERGIKPLHRKKQLPQELVEQYQRGELTQPELAAKAGVGLATAQKRLAEKGIRKGPRAIRPEVLEMRRRRREGESLEQISSDFHISRERVRQLTQGVKPERRALTIKAVAAQMNCCTASVHKALRKLGISNDLVAGISEEHLPAIRDVLVRSCQEPGCSERFMPRRNERYCPQHQWSSLTASQLLKRQCRRPPRAGKAVQVYEALKAVPAGEEFVGLAEACLLSGLSHVQMTWLRNRGVIASRDTGKLHCSGGTVHRYSKAHAEAIAALTPPPPGSCTSACDTGS